MLLAWAILSGTALLAASPYSSSPLQASEVSQYIPRRIELRLAPAGPLRPSLATSTYSDQSAACTFGYRGAHTSQVTSFPYLEQIQRPFQLSIEYTVALTVPIARWSLGEVR